jgi:hypothetical protein
MTVVPAMGAIESALKEAGRFAREWDRGSAAGGAPGKVGIGRWSAQGSGVVRVRRTNGAARRTVQGNPGIGSVRVHYPTAPAQLPE